MSFEISGRLDKLQKQMADASRAFEALDGEITTLKFDPNDQTSVEAAISDMERAINFKVAAFKGNPLVDGLVSEMKTKYRDQILEKVMESKITSASPLTDGVKPDNLVFRQIENTVADLRHSDSRTFTRHMEKLSRLLHSESLGSISKGLEDTTDLESWIKEGLTNQGGMVGSARLRWPSDPKQELGLVIKLIDSFAKQPEEAINFAHTFYYNGINLTNNLQNMVAQMIVPFVRDYIDHVKAVTGAHEATLLPQPSGPSARKAFVVHGRDDGAREAVARFLESMGFEAIILHEQANQGRTIIEKIEAHGDAGFAVVLLTPDDEGCSKGGSPSPRARQNVLLELGYFIGRLGRSRVVALKRGNIEIPSDFAGVVYEPFDEGNGWKQALGRELQAAGFEVDWNKIFRR